MLAYLFPVLLNLRFYHSIDSLVIICYMHVFDINTFTGTYYAFGPMSSFELFTHSLERGVHSDLLVFSLRLVGGPSVQRFPLTPFERSYIVSTALPHAIK